MALAKVFAIGSAVTFAAIGAIALFKGPREEVKKELSSSLVEEVPLPVQKQPLEPVVSESIPMASPVVEEEENLPEADRIHRLFALDSKKLPIVETISYTSRVPWLKGRPAWIADYATYFSTSRHFIARSLNRTVDYFTQKVSPGDRFNVFKKNQEIQFHLLIDLSRCKLWFYYIDEAANERVLLKTYKVGVGRQDHASVSGYLTPVGKYLLGSKIAIYKPSTLGFFQDQKIEMIRVFGTRWIPFDKEVEGCSEAARGFGLHGVPWIEDANGQLVEDLGKIGNYDSDGCIRLASQDIEELFSIVITKPTFVEIVKDFRQAKLPGEEKDL